MIVMEIDKNLEIILPLNWQMPLNYIGNFLPYILLNIYQIKEKIIIPGKLFTYI